MEFYRLARDPSFFPAVHEVQKVLNMEMCKIHTKLSVIEFRQQLTLRRKQAAMLCRESIEVVCERTRTIINHTCAYRLRKSFGFVADFIGF